MIVKRKLCLIRARSYPRVLVNGASGDRKASQFNKTVFADQKEDFIIECISGIFRSEKYLVPWKNTKTISYNVNPLLRVLYLICIILFLITLYMISIDIFFMVWVTLSGYVIYGILYFSYFRTRFYSFKAFDIENNRVEIKLYKK